MADSKIRFGRILMRLRRLIRNDQLILSILAVFVGAVAGGGVIAIRELIDWVLELDSALRVSILAPILPIDPAV